MSNSLHVAPSASLNAWFNSHCVCSGLDVPSFQHQVNSKLLWLEDKVSSLTGMVDGILYRSLVEIRDKLLVLSQMLEDHSDKFDEYSYASKARSKVDSKVNKSSTKTVHSKININHSGNWSKTAKKIVVESQSRSESQIFPSPSDLRLIWFITGIDRLNSVPVIYRLVTGLFQQSKSACTAFLVERTNKSNDEFPIFSIHLPHPMSYTEFPKFGLMEFVLIWVGVSVNLFQILLQLIRIRILLKLFL